MSASSPKGWGKGMFAKARGETKVTYSLARKDMVGFLSSRTFLTLCVNWKTLKMGEDPLLFSPLQPRRFPEVYPRAATGSQ